MIPSSIPCVVRCPAKVNLGLQVLARGEDGYHDQRTVFQTLALHDRLRIEVAPPRKRGGIDFSCNVEELAGPSNLAVRAAEAVLAESGVRRGVRMELHKTIPAGAGLGGGSSDAAAVLRALPDLLGRRIDRNRLLCLAASLGADVPFFLVGGRAVGIGRGTEVYPLPEDPARAVVVVYPGIHVSTAEAYRKLDEARTASPHTGPTGSRALTTAGSPDIIFYFGAAVYGRSWDRIANDFEPVVFSAYPELARLKGVLLRAGASPALLCGSGSAVFGMFDTGAAARSAAVRVRRQWPRWQVWVTRTLSRRQLAGDGPEHA